MISLKKELKEGIQKSKRLVIIIKCINLCFRSNKSKQSAKDLMYGQLEKIMSNCFTNERKETHIDAQEYKTLKYADTDENSHQENSNSSNLSSPLTAQRITETHKENALDYLNKNEAINIHESNKAEKDDLITPRDIKSSPSYQTPTTKHNIQETKDILAQKEVSKSTLQENYESGRRENAFNFQFYSNNSDCIDQEENKTEGNDDNIKIYVDQWDGNHSDKNAKSITSTEPYNGNGSIGIHTAKNSPLESNSKDKEQALSDKYSVTEESIEKNLSEARIGNHAFDYNKPSLNNIRNNLHSTLQENLENSQTSFDFKGKNRLN